MRGDARSALQAASMKMISHQDFGRLRLGQFFPNKEEIAELAGWEFMDRLWVGEAVEFTEWLRLANDPTILRSLSLDLVTLPKRVAKAVLKRVGLPLHPGMTLAEIRKVLGEPINEMTYVRDRKSYEYSCGNEDRYDVSCTVHNQDGLVYVVVMVSGIAGVL